MAMMLMTWGVRLATALGLIAAAPALAGPLLIQPTTVQFASDRHSAAVEVVNQSSDPATLQFRAYRWTQEDGRDRLEASADLMVSPPIVIVPPHGSQVFRILDKAPSPGGGERSYRLKLGEVPGATAPTTIAIQVEFSLPVFLTPPGAVPDLTARIADGVLSVANRGTRRVRLTGLTLEDGHGRRTAIAAAAGTYLLAGAGRHDPLPTGWRIGPAMRLIATTDNGPVDVPVESPASR